MCDCLIAYQDRHCNLLTVFAYCPACGSPIAVDDALVKKQASLIDEHQRSGFAIRDLRRMGAASTDCVRAETTPAFNIDVLDGELSSPS